jgi:hypothetical protein
MQVKAKKGILMVAVHTFETVELAGAYAKIQRIDQGKTGAVPLSRSAFSSAAQADQENR